MKLLIEGKAKKIFSTKDKNTIVQFFKDDATAFNNKKRKLFKSKGILNNCISALIFQYLNKNRIKTHFIEKISEWHGEEFNWGVRHYRGRSIILWDTLRDFKS